MRDRIDIENEIRRLNRNKESSDSLAMIGYIQGEVDALLWVLKEVNK